MSRDPQYLIDTHTHITFPEFEKDFDKVLKRAKKAGIEYMIAIGSGDGAEGNQKAVDLAKKYSNIYATVGIHPNEASLLGSEYISTVRELLKNEKVVAVGEIGLDYYRKHTPQKIQIERFEQLLEVAAEAKLPVSIHDREAHKDTLFAIRKKADTQLGGVFHCFSGDVAIAREALDIGYMIAIPGIVTFGKKANELVDVVKYVPIEKIVLETDSPYLAPVPYRGKRNEPAYVEHIARKVAEIKGLSFEDVARITTLNAKRLFRLPGAEPEAKIAYSIRKSLYLNITNRCHMDCTFCPKRSGSFEVKGYNLKLDHEPDVEEVFRAIGDVSGFDEIVFCGFGEPTVRLELLKTIASNLKERGMKIRLNTDGLANLVYGRNIVSELKGLVDVVSVSLNASDPKTFAKLCPSKYGEEAFNAVVDFVRESKKLLPKVIATVVTVPKLDIDACRKFVDKELGVELRIRDYQEVG
jgi:TatD DNase family protein